MSSDISCIVIKSDRISRKIPTLGEIVGVYGEKSRFVVMNVDHSSRVAQLMERGDKHRLVDVSFTSVQTLKHNLSQIIHRFLEATDEAKSRGAAPAPLAEQHQGKDSPGEPSG